MNIITLGLLAGAGFLFFSSSKKSSGPTIAINLPKGFEISADCKNFSVSDYDAAMKWAFNEGKKVIGTVNSVEEKTAEFQFSLVGTCDPKKISETKENALFVYDIMFKWMEGVVTRNPSLIYNMYIAMGILRVGAINEFKKYKISSSELKKPLDLPTLNKLICPLRGFNFKDCTLTVTNEAKMMKFVYNTSKFFGKVAIDNDITLNNEFNTLIYILFGFEDQEKCKEEFPLKIQYLMLYNFIKAFVDVGSLEKENANKILAEKYDVFGKVINEYNLPTKI